MTTPLGLTVASLGALGIQGALDVTSAAAAAGYSSVYTAETVGFDAFTLLGALGAAEPGLDLGTGVIPIQLRTPPLVAMAAATLQALHPERDIVVGIGISSPVVTAKWHGAPYGDRPLARIREYVALVRECLSGESVSFKGDFWEVSRFRLGVRLGERKPKIVIGALNPGMLRLAGEVADGVMLNYLPASHVPWSIEQVRKGGDATIYAYVHACVGDPEQQAVYARRDLFSYAVVDAYRDNFARAGFADEMDDLRERHAAGDREGSVNAVSDAMVQAIDPIGTADEIEAVMRAYVDAGVEVPILMPNPWGDDRRATTFATIEAAARIL